MLFRVWTAYWKLPKESNRAKTLQQEFTKMGINIKLQDDLMFIEGGKIKSATIDSHNDHRIAMAGYLFNVSSI